MKKEEQLTRATLSNVIREEFSRLTQESRKPSVETPGCGCELEKGCCQDRGCCNDKGGCGDLFDKIGDRVDILMDYVESHKEPIIKFFKEKGVKLKF
jgi:hypothetical protein